MKKLYFLSIMLSALLFLPYNVAAQSKRNMKAKFTWEIANTSATNMLTVNALIPTDIEGRQKVHSVRFTPQPSIDKIIDGNRHATFIFRSPSIPKLITIEVDMTIYKHGLSSQRAIAQDAADPDASKYLGSDEFIETNHPAIKALADSLQGKSQVATIKNICYYLAENIEYKLTQPSIQSALTTLEKKTGVCTDYSNLMMALCRANGMPARGCSGYILDNIYFVPGWDLDSRHVWVEVYLDEYGWVAFDPTSIDAKNWQKMPVNYVYLSRNTPDSDVGVGSILSYGWEPRVDSYFSVK